MIINLSYTNPINYLSLCLIKEKSFLKTHSTSSYPKRDRKLPQLFFTVFSKGSRLESFKSNPEYPNCISNWNTSMDANTSELATVQCTICWKYHRRCGFCSWIFRHLPIFFHIALNFYLETPTKVLHCKRQLWSQQPGLRKRSVIWSQRKDILIAKN